MINGCTDLVVQRHVSGLARFKFSHAQNPNEFNQLFSAHPHDTNSTPTWRCGNCNDGRVVL
jgi:hypothetical protein